MTSVKTLLQESNFGLPKSAENKYLVKLIGSDVQGSSGYYSKEMLEQYVPAAFPKGTKVYADHGDSTDVRSVKSLAGKFISEPVLKEDGAYAEVQFGRDYANLVEDFHDVLGMSIYVQGDIEESEDESGNIVRKVTSLYPSPLNSVDLVSVPGAQGGIAEKLAESFREIEADERKVQVDEKDIKAIAEAVAASLKEPFTTLAEAVDALKPPAPKEDEENEPDMAAVTESAVEAGLPKSARQRVVEAVKAGADADEAIKAEKGYIDQVLEEAGKTAEEGHIRESGNQGDYASQIAEFFKAGDK